MIELTTETLVIQLGKRKYDKTVGEFIYAFDLVDEIYFGSQFILTYGLNLEGLSTHKALKELLEFKGTIRKMFDAKEAIRTLEGRL